MLASALAGGAAQAETLPVEGVYGAPVEVPAAIERIAVERFSGDRGFGLQSILRETLSEPVLESAFFTFIPASLVVREGGAVPDAALAGHADGFVSDYRTDPKTKSRCIKRDAEDKCVERERYEVACRELRVDYEAEVSLVAREGEAVYHASDQLSDTARYCADDNHSPDPAAMLDALEARFATRVERDLLPAYRQSTPRLMERRRGLSGADRRVFKHALHASDRDLRTGCEAFRALETANPQHVSVLFNIGLCFESEGALGSALDYYARALEIEPGKDYPEAGQRRVLSRLRGEAQLDARGM
ncbi:hypothetical protein [Qipengyuania nanhaisediminis]|uniref:hypothetical protein n=1 Tax=Qipengyuania nanhaisediminis TaxID=604088 RepID=UPI0038B3FD40